MSEIRRHTPVMLAQVLDGLSLSPGQVVVDATVGAGGHSIEIIKRILPGGRLICIDRDEEALSLAKERLKEYGSSCGFVHGNFSDIDTILAAEQVEAVDGIVFDLGVSMMQLDSPERGFSFRFDGPLDMRMDKDSYISAADLLNSLSEDEISQLLLNFGQERWHRRIARALVSQRVREPIATTKQLADLVEHAIPRKFRSYRIHPATRTFQAVRIAVNRELETLEGALHKAIGLLKVGGRICVISFHSLEDRIVKVCFRDAAREQELTLVTRKPLTPTQEEVRENPASCSSKLRVAQRI